MDYTYSDVKFATVHGIFVAIEGLNAQICSYIPQTNCLVTTSAHKYLAEGLELNWIYTVHVASKGKSRLFHIHVPKFHSVIHTTW